MCGDEKNDKGQGEAENGLKWRVISNATLCQVNSLLVANWTCQAS